MPPFHILSYSHPLSHPFISDNNMVNTTPTQLCLRCLNNSNPILNPISFSRQGTRFEFTPKPREDLVYICFQYYSRLIEIKFFIKMLYGVWSSLQSAWNKQISAPDASQPSSQERWQVADLKHFKISYIFSLPRISTKDFPYIKGKIDQSIGINYSSVNFKWTQILLCY